MFFRRKVRSASSRVRLASCPFGFVSVWPRVVSVWRRVRLAYRLAPESATRTVSSVNKCWLTSYLSPFTPTSSTPHPNPLARYHFLPQVPLHTTDIILFLSNLGCSATLTVMHIFPQMSLLHLLRWASPWNWSSPAARAVSPCSQLWALQLAYITKATPSPASTSCCCPVAGSRLR